MLLFCEFHAAILSAALRCVIGDCWIVCAETVGREPQRVDAELRSEHGSNGLGAALRKIQIVFGVTDGIRVAVDLQLQVWTALKEVSTLACLIVRPKAG